ncbi:MAG: flavodoxin domain-containing protein [Candidatus Heimdallarchaeaceae archaeon]
MSKTLIVYGTRYSATTEACAEIQKILEKEYNQHVEIWDLENYRACPDLSDFDNVIIASGIKYGKWTKNAEKYLSNNFEGKKVAVFISSAFAGDEDLHEYAYENFLVKVLEEYPNLDPVAKAAFGGRIPKKELPEFAKGPKKFIPEIASKQILTRLHENQYDNRDWDKIEKWAHEVGKLFNS